MFIDYMEQLLGRAKFNTSHTEANWDCPFCTDTRTRFRMHTSKLVGWCFNCEWKGNAVKFISDFQNVSWAEAFDIVNFYEEFRPLPQDIYDEVFDKLFAEDIEVEGKHVISLPRDFQPLATTNSIQSKRFLEYARQRGVTDEQIIQHGLGFCTEGEMKLSETKKVYLNDHLFIQTYDDNDDPLYWMTRAIRGQTVPKVFNPVGTVNSINKSEVIFNLNNAKREGVAVITEGVFDAMTLGNWGVALFGKTMSIKQLLLLVKANLNAVYVMLDPDAFDSALKMADLLSKHINSVYLCNIEEGDPNSIGRRGCLEVLSKATKYDKLSAIKYKLRI